MDALSESLQQGLLAGAGIDVFETEPPISQNHPLINSPNGILTPHIAYATKEAFELRIEIVINNIKTWLKSF
jgi:D-3-phosphoglycerate dehydrogenase